ncbi:SLAP domain-containing protein [Companilactobacillus kedongensis]|uniref:SLAP domain-containing protein n=1 Tax=Companilactobacillus kedongensis TaxID=2486004 RepID=UPI0013DD9C5E|nr:SLAP domain-containing protein [Companilactobacillus kedongensis]
MNLKKFTHRVNSDWIVVSILTIAGGLILPGNMLINVQAATSEDSGVVTNQVSYTINYLDADTGKIIGTKSGNSASGSKITIPQIRVAGYSEKFSESDTYKLSDEPSQTISVTMHTVPNNEFIIKERGADENQNWIKEIEFDVKVNDTNYKKIISDNFKKFQRGRKIIFEESYFGYDRLSSFSYLKGMENSSPEEILLKILEMQGNSEVLSDHYRDTDIVFQYAPLEGPYEERFVAKGGYLDGQVLYSSIDDDPDPTVLGRAIWPKDAVAGYYTGSDDDNNVSYDAENKILTFKLLPIPDAKFVVNEFNKNGKFIKTVQISPKTYTTINFENEFFKKLDLDRNVILDKSILKEFKPEEIELGEKALSNFESSLDADHSLGHIIHEIVSHAPYQKIPEEFSGSTLEANFYLEDDPNHHNESVPSINTTSKPVSKVPNQNIATSTQVRLYDQHGKLVTNRELEKNTKWNDVPEVTINNEKYYRISNDEYVKAIDVYVYKKTDASKIRVKSGQGKLIDHLGNISKRELDPLSEWKTDLIALIKDKKYYRVSTDEFIDIAKVFIL